jgi:L-asparaginase II
MPSTTDTTLDTTVGTNPVLIEVVRGPLVESRHRASVAVVDSAGQILFARGDVEQIVLPRSSLKPFQAISMVASGAMETFGLTDVELALHCGSHNGEPRHVALVGQWLDKIGCRESQLECGIDRPLGEKWLHLKPEECAVASKLANNCSGKHTGFMTTALHMGVPVQGYSGMEHPVQKFVAGILADLSGSSVHDMPVAQDNCGVPVFGIPLNSLALASARMAGRDEGTLRGRAIIRVFDAMRTHPFLIAGSGRADTLLMQDSAFGGISKVGAEGVFMASIPSSANTAEADLGLAIKIDDGGDRASSALGVAALRHLGALDQEAGSRLFDQIARPSFGPDGKIVGHLRVSAQAFA